MSKVKIFLSTLVLVFIVFIYNSLYAANITLNNTKENFKKSIEEYVTYIKENDDSEEKKYQDFNIEVLDDTLKIQLKGIKKDVKYSIEDGLIKLESLVKVYKGMTYKEYAEQISMQSSLTTLLFPPIAKLKEVEYEDSAAYALYTYMHTTFKYASSSSGSGKVYKIIDDLNTEDGVTIEKDPNAEDVIYTSEFGDKVMEIVENFKLEYEYEDQYKLYKVINSKKDFSSDLGYIAYTFIVDLNSDFTKIKDYAENMGSNDKNENVEKLPEAGIDFTYEKALNIILVTGSVLLVLMAITATLKKNIND